MNIKQLNKRLQEATTLIDAGDIDDGLGNAYLASTKKEAIDFLKDVKPLDSVAIVSGDREITITKINDDKYSLQLDDLNIPNDSARKGVLTWEYLSYDEVLKLINLANTNV